MRSLVLAPLLCLTLAGPALAQGAVGVPPIEQEPRPGTVQQRERARGLAPSAQENQAQERTVDQIYRELTGRSPAMSGPGMTPSASGTPAQDARTSDQLYRDLTGSSPSLLAPAAPPPTFGTPQQDSRTTDQLYRDLTGSNPLGTR